MSSQNSQVYDLQSLALIGQSSSSKIYLIPQQQNFQNQYVLKVIAHTSVAGPCLEQCEHLKKEFETCQTFQHQNLQKQIAFFPGNIQGEIQICQKLGFNFSEILVQNVDGCSILMEYANGGDLVSQINSNMSAFYNLTLLKEIFQKVGAGLLEMHKKGYAHNDIKLENIFVSQNMERDSSEYQIQLSDFGFSNNRQISKKSQEKKFQKRQREYLSPEFLRLATNQNQNLENNQGNCRNLESFLMLDEQANDIYALGITMFETFAKFLPYKHQNLPREEDLVYQQLNSGNLKNLWKQFPRHFQMMEKMGGHNSQEDILNFFQLVQSMVTQNVEHRINIQQVLSSPFFN